jgi:hypothetical protein
MFYAKGAGWYQGYFRSCSSTAVVGEVTPTYFALAEARERIARDLPGCKIVCTLRDPVSRAWSWYRVLHREGRIRRGFLDEMLRGNEPQLRQANRYALHLRAWRERFGEENVGVFLYDDLRANPQSFADSVLRFLGLPSIEVDTIAAYLMRNEADDDCRIPALAYGAWRLRMSLKSLRAERTVERLGRLGVWRLCFGGGGRFAPLPGDVEHRLREFFVPEVEALEELIGRDLSSWKVRSAREQKRAASL